MCSSDLSDDREGAATALYTALAVINTLKVALYPYLPFTCQRLHGYLGYDGDAVASGWRAELPSPGQPLREPAALFRKLEPSALDEETQPS